MKACIFTYVPQNIGVHADGCDCGSELSYNLWFILQQMHYGKNCAGCGQEGQTLLGRMPILPVHKKRNVEHRSFYKEFPYDYFMSTYDSAE